MISIFEKVYLHFPIPSRSQETGSCILLLKNIHK